MHLREPNQVLVAFSLIRDGHLSDQASCGSNESEKKEGESNHKNKKDGDGAWVVVGKNIGHTRDAGLGC
jgi:hypothetical protein